MLSGKIAGVRLAYFAFLIIWWIVASGKTAYRPFFYRRQGFSTLAARRFGISGYDHDGVTTRTSDTI